MLFRSGLPAHPSRVRINSMTILAGDIGGTNSRLAIFDQQLNKLAERDFENKGRSSLSQCVSEFLREADCKPDRACFGIAGPVSHGKVEMTNLGWTIDEADIASQFKIEKVRLINDMMAHAEGIEVLQPDQIVTLKAGEELEGNRCIIAAGTGLGEGGLAWNRDHWIPFASEGGHTDFSPTDDEQDQLLQWGRKRFNGQVCWEHLVSGPGMKTLYEFLLESRSDLKDRLPAGEAGSKQITKAIAKSDIARATAELFARLYLSEAGNLYGNNQNTTEIKNLVFH